MLDPALQLLTRMQFRGFFRRLFKGMRTPKGALFALIGVAVFFLWLAPMLWMTKVRPPSNPHDVRLVAPVMLMMLTLATLFTGAGERAIAFMPAEVNFLFPGPFTRRQLLLFKLSRSLAGAVFSAFVLSVVLRHHASSWHAGFIGAALAMAMTQLATLALILATQVLGSRAHSMFRRIVLTACGLAAALAILPTLAEARRQGTLGFVQVAATLDGSLATRIMLAPFKPFALAFAAPTWDVLLPWAAVCVAIDALLIGIVVRLDADYRDAAVAASQRTLARLQRLRRGQVIAPIGKAGTRRRKWIGMFPWLGGAGPTAWRQLTAAIRTSRTMLFLLLIMSVGFIPMVLTAHEQFTPIVTIGVWATFILTTMLRFDFRAEVDQLAWLKAMPLSPLSMTIGQLAVPVVVLAAVQLLLMASAIAIAPPSKVPALLAALPFLIPFNIVLLGIENTMFLLFPSRVAGAAPTDPAVMGRQILLFLLKLVVVFVAGALAATVGEITFLVTDRSIIAGTVMAWMVLVSFAVGVVPCVGWAYSRFDPSADTPP